MLGERFHAEAIRALQETLTEAQREVLANRPLVATVREAAHRLGVSVRTVEKWISTGALPRVPHTTRVLIPHRALEEFANSCLVGWQPPEPGDPRIAS